MKHERLHGLDGVRAAMMLLGLLLHAAISYDAFPHGDAWPYEDASTTRVFAYAIVFIHVFRMPVFYVMAGFFAALLLARRGSGGLVRNRATRILVPFVVGWIVLVPLTRSGFWFALTASRSSLAEGWHAVAKVPLLGWYSDTTIHLWFLYDLMYFYAAALVVAAGLRRLPRAWRDTAMSGFARVVRSPWRPLWLAAPTALALWPMGGSLRTSTSFVPDPSVLAAYGLFFGFGCLLYARRELLPSFDRHAWPQLALACALAPVNFKAIERVIATRLDPDPVALAVTAFTGALIAWLMVFGLTGLFQRFLDKPIPAVRYLTDASYWLYLIHLPFAIWIPGLLSRLAWSPWLKVAVLLGISVPIWLLSYDLLVRNTVIGRVLNGQRYPRGLPGPEAPARQPLAQPTG